MRVERRRGPGEGEALGVGLASLSLSGVDDLEGQGTEDEPGSIARLSGAADTEPGAEDEEPGPGVSSSSESSLSEPEPRLNESGLSGALPPTPPASGLDARGL